MPHPMLAGSKAKAKAAAREARITAAFRKRMSRLYEYARLLKDEDELDRFLQQTTDDAVRAETKKLLEPLCLFPFRKIVLADAPLEDHTKPVVVHHAVPGVH